jgi:hypothetical protein
VVLRPDAGGDSTAVQGVAPPAEAHCCAARHVLVIVSYLTVDILSELFNCGAVVMHPWEVLDMARLLTGRALMIKIYLFSRIRNT